ncbi:hypothetical protein ACFX13_044752 [Malus domestica]
MAELVGTYILIFIGCGAALVNKIQPLTIVGIVIAWGLVLMAAAYAVGHVSGVHFNPAVTIALAAGRRFPVPMYVMSQLSGATLASLTLKLLLNDQDSIQATMTQFFDPTTYLQALTWEFVITFILMFTICGVVTDDRAKAKKRVLNCFFVDKALTLCLTDKIRAKILSGIAIGAAFVVNVMIAGPITGTSMNPTRSFGPAIVTGVYKNIWVYIAAPIPGATIAAIVLYSVLRVPKPVKSDEKADPIIARTLSQV